MRKKLWKKMLILGLTACLCLLAGCEAMQQAPDEAAMTETAVQSVVAMIAGRHEDVVAKMDETCKKTLSAQALSQAWDQTTASLGTFVERKEAEVTTVSNQTQVVVPCVFTVRELLVTVAINAKNEISGLWLSYGDATDPAIAESISYQEIDITIGTEPTVLRGRLTLPKGVDKPPVVVMVQGSGQHGMDETIGKAGNQPFRDLALGLAEQGVATIRFDKRYFMYPEQAAEVAETITVEQEILDDVALALAFAAAEDRVDQQQIFLLGHSLGGMLAPRIAHDHPTVRGIISMAGSLRGLEDIIADQNAAALATATLTEKQREKQMAMVMEEVEKVKGLTEDGKQISAFGMPGSYWLSLNRARGDLFAAQLEIPMLILQGKADFQVSVEKDFQSWQDLLGEKPNVTYQAYDDLNHLFMPTTGKQDITDYDTPARVASNVIADIAAWVQEQAS